MRKIKIISLCLFYILTVNAQTKISIEREKQIKDHIYEHYNDPDRYEHIRYSIYKDDFHNYYSEVVYFLDSCYSNFGKRFQYSITSLEAAPDNTIGCMIITELKDTLYLKIQNNAERYEIIKDEHRAPNVYGGLVKGEHYYVFQKNKLLYASNSISDINYYIDKFNNYVVSIDVQKTFKNIGNLTYNYKDVNKNGYSYLESSLYTDLFNYFKNINNIDSSYMFNVTYSLDTNNIHKIEFKDVCDENVKDIFRKYVLYESCVKNINMTYTFYFKISLSNNISIKKYTWDDINKVLIRPDDYNTLQVKSGITPGRYKVKTTNVTINEKSKNYITFIKRKPGYVSTLIIPAYVLLFFFI